MNDSTNYRKLIIENYSQPTHKGLKKAVNSLIQHQQTESCVDDIFVELIIAHNKIISARFDGIGCAISTASTNMMAQLLENNTVKQGQLIIENYLQMINQKSYNPALLGDLVAFINIHNQPNRIRCATLGINGYRDLITNNQSA